MYFKHPTYKKDKNNGFIEGYKFKEIDSLTLSIETNIFGGWNPLSASKSDRVLYVLKGLGNAKISGKTYELTENDVLEIPAGQVVELSGQLRFISVESKA